MEINPSEVTKILKEQIKNFGEKAEVAEVGQVLSVGVVSQEFMVWIMYKLVKWWNLQMDQKEWLLT